MRELCAEAGLSVATVKFYLREGLLPPGERTGPNQADYDESHVRRLRLIRSLAGIGGLSIAAIRDVLADSAHDLLKAGRGKLDVTDEERAWALDRISAMAESRGWDLRGADTAVSALVGVLCAFRRLGHCELLDHVDSYAELAEAIARLDRTADAETSPAGTVLGDILLVALRRLARRRG
ncbi:MerR family transcriptional regulator [Alloactinosynnema sp. L-07]|uniref:MerR family transcriptional regulator n=1 Tax=Alloactinosynnema sp. L-07 TaxID=1653480 RepID=UPI000830E0C0